LGTVSQVLAKTG